MINLSLTSLRRYVRKIVPLVFICAIVLAVGSLLTRAIATLFITHSTYVVQKITTQTISPLQQASTGSPIPTITRYGLVSKNEDNGTKTIEYTYESPVFMRRNQIITHDGKVIFERIMTPTDPNSPSYAKISSYTDQFGDPQRIVKGSRFYGFYMTTYIYASKGFAFVANTHTDAIYEFQKFAPTTLDEYIATFGQDLNPAGKPGTQ
jgi:hypothetical protein